MLCKHDLDFFWKIANPLIYLLTVDKKLYKNDPRDDQPVSDEAFLYFQIYVIQDIIRYCMAVCQQICQFLEIYCFDIVTPFPKKTTKNSWEEAPAASRQTRWMVSRETSAEIIFLFTYLCMNGVYNHFIFLIFGTSYAFIGQGFIYSLLSNLSTSNPVFLSTLSIGLHSLQKWLCADCALSSHVKSLRRKIIYYWHTTCKR